MGRKASPLEVRLGRVACAALGSRGGGLVSLDGVDGGQEALVVFLGEGGRGAGVGGGGGGEEEGLGVGGELLEGGGRRADRSGRRGRSRG